MRYWKRKNGVRWQLYRTGTGYEILDEKQVTFFPLPTVKLEHTKGESDSRNSAHEYEFDIVFLWLFWEIHLERRWIK